MIKIAIDNEDGLKDCCLLISISFFLPSHMGTPNLIFCTFALLDRIFRVLPRAGIPPIATRPVAPLLPIGFSSHVSPGASCSYSVPSDGLPGHDSPVTWPPPVSSFRGGQPTGHYGRNERRNAGIGGQGRWYDPLPIGPSIYPN